MTPESNLFTKSPKFLTQQCLDLLPDEDGIPLMVVDGLDDNFRMIKEIFTQL